MLLCIFFVRTSRLHETELSHFYTVLQIPQADGAPVRHTVAVTAPPQIDPEYFQHGNRAGAGPPLENQFAPPSFSDMHAPEGKAPAVAMTPPTLEVPHSPPHEEVHGQGEFSPQDYGEGFMNASDSRMEGSMAKSIIMSEQLEALTARVPIAGQTVAAIIRLMDLCVAAKPVAQNARELARLCLDVVDLIEDLVDMDDILNEYLFKVCLPLLPCLFLHSICKQ
jgi:hypothetical protein